MKFQIKKLQLFKNWKKFVQFCQIFILLQEGSNAQQRTYLYQRTKYKKAPKNFWFFKKIERMLLFECEYLGNMKSQRGQFRLIL